MDNSNPTFAHFGIKFQEKLSFLILEDRVFADRMTEVLKVDFLEKKSLQWFVEKIFDYKNKYKTHPSRETMETIIKSSIEKENEFLQTEIPNFYARMTKTLTIEDAAFIKNESIDFCRKQKLHESILRAAGLLKTNSFDEIKKVIDEGLKAGSEIDTGHDYIKDFEKRYVENVRFPIKTGWDKLDEILSGGLGKSEYGIIMSPTGAGKSQFLVHLGAEAVKKGYKVVYYTLELRDTVIGQRFDACFTGFPIDELKENKEDILKQIVGYKDKIKIKFFPKKSVSMFGIRLHLDRLRSEGFVPDMIILDYLDLLKSGTVRKELRHELGETYDEFESLNQELNTVGWTASQTNRTGVSSNTIQMDHMSEAFNKNFGSYLTLGLSRNNNDKMNNTGRLSVIKNRSGPDGITFNIFMDPANVDIKILDEYQGEANDDLSDPDELKRRTAIKYKKFKMKEEMKEAMK